MQRVGYFQFQGGLWQSQVGEVILDPTRLQEANQPFHHHLQPSEGVAIKKSTLSTKIIVCYYRISC